MRSILLGLPERNAEEHRRQHSRSALAKLCAKMAVCLEPKWLQGVREKRFQNIDFGIWYDAAQGLQPPGGQERMQPMSSRRVSRRPPADELVSLPDFLNFSFED